MPLEAQKSEEEEKTPSYDFMTQEWEDQWKAGLNLENVKQAIKYTDDKARTFLQLNPSADNHIDADKVSP